MQNLTLNVSRTSSNLQSVDSTLNDAFANPGYSGSVTMSGLDPDGNPASVTIQFADESASS